MIDYFTPKDFINEKQLKIFQREIRGPSLKEMEASKKLI
jgi:hypothetical protein